MNIKVKTIETISITINDIELNLNVDEVIELQKQLKEIVNTKCGKNEPFKGKEINGNNDVLDRIKKESEDRFKYEKKVPFDWNNTPKYDYSTYRLDNQNHIINNQSSYNFK